MVSSRLRCPTGKQHRYLWIGTCPPVLARRRKNFRPGRESNRGTAVFVRPALILVAILNKVPGFTLRILCYRARVLGNCKIGKVGLFFIFIREVLVSYPGSKASCPDRSSSCYFSAFPSKCRDITLILRYGYFFPLPLKLLLTNYSVSRHYVIWEIQLIC